jgi:hypothetical protein
MAGTHHKREIAKHPDTMWAILEDLEAVNGSADRGMEALDTARDRVSTSERRGAARQRSKEAACSSL